MSIQRLSCFFNLCSSWSSCSNKRRRDCLLPPPAAGCAAAQASPPHRTHIAGLAIPLLTHTCCYSPATADEPVNPHTVVLPSAWETTAESSLPPCRFLPRPRRRPPPWCSRRGLVNVVNDRHASEVDCTWRGRQLGPQPHARKCLLITRKIMIPPPDIRDPPKGPLYFAKKTLPPLTARTHQLYLRTQGSASLLRTKKMNTPPVSWDPV